MKYIAPEAISGKKYNHMVDWWSLGIIIYRMLTGKLPYPSNKNHEVKIFIIKCQIKISKYKFSKSAHKLLTRLFDKNPNTRLGSNGVEEIMSHEFFKGINWDALYKKEINPPYMPKLKSDNDTKLFPTEMLSRDIEGSSLDDTDVRSGNMRGLYFKDFTYTKETLIDDETANMLSDF